MMFRCVRELAEAGFPVSVACRVLQVSRSGYYDWARRVPSCRQLADRQLLVTIRQIHQMSRGSYGAPRVHAELRLGMGVRCGRKRVARLMAADGLTGICHRRKRGHKPMPATHEDLVQRCFTATGPDRLWFTDITRTAPPTAGCTAARSWTPSHAGSWADRSPTTSVPSWWSTRCRWRAGNANPSARSCMPTGVPSTPRGCSGTGCGRPGCSARWAGSPHPKTTQRWSRSGPRCSASSLTSGRGDPVPSFRARFSSGSRAGTTPAGATPASGCVPRTNSKLLPSPPRTRHDHHTETVRETGSGSVGD